MFHVTANVDIAALPMTSSLLANFLGVPSIYPALAVMLEMCVTSKTVVRNRYGVHVVTMMSQF